MNKTGFSKYSDARLSKQKTLKLPAKKKTNLTLGNERMKFELVMLQVKMKHEDYCCRYVFIREVCLYSTHVIFFLYFIALPQK